MADIEYLRIRFDHFNAMCFGSSLKPVRIELMRSRTQLGQLRYMRRKKLFGGWRYDDFTLRITSVVDMDEALLEDTLLHEMIHYSILSSQKQDTSAHGVLFRQMMEEIKAQRDLIYAINGLLKPNKAVFKASEVLDFVKGSLCQIASDMYNVNIIIESTLTDEDLESDKVLINRVIHNMVKNACEDNAAGDVIVRAKVEDNAIIYSVHNDAVMSLDTKSKVFIQGNTTKKQGHGLGTYSMKLIGENYLGGKVYFKYEKNFGTEFYFELPNANP